MKKFILTIASILLLLSCGDKKSDQPKESRAALNTLAAPVPITKEEPEPYFYDTILKNGYHLSYRVYYDSLTETKLESLTLVKGKKDITELNSLQYPMLQKNLGYIGVDFSDSFVFTQSFGSGNPHLMQLIEKETGRETCHGIWVDADENEEVLLYIPDTPEPEQLALYDIKNNNEITINDFRDSECMKTMTGGLRNCVIIDTVTTNEIVLKGNPEFNENYIRKYKRNI